MRLDADREKSNTIQIAFGTIFTVFSEGETTEKRHLVYDIGSGRDFYSAQLEQDEEGPFFGFGGTNRTEIIGDIVDQMSLEKVIEAAKLGARKLNNYEFEQWQVDGLIESANKGARTIVLNR